MGEADTKNCMNQYKGSMAEKRGKDRCILKIINAYQYQIYSDVEADDFKKPKQTYEHRTESQVKEFDGLKNKEPLNLKKADVNNDWKKCTNIKEYESVLRRMRKTIKTYEDSQSKLINQDLDDQLSNKIGG